MVAAAVYNVARTEESMTRGTGNRAWSGLGCEGRVCAVSSYMSVQAVC